MILTYRYRLLPLKSQHRALERLCESQRELYNAALQERIDCYRKTGKTRTYIDQFKALTECRRELHKREPEHLAGRDWPVGAQRDRLAMSVRPETYTDSDGVRYINPS